MHLFQTHLIQTRDLLIIDPTIQHCHLSLSITGVFLVRTHVRLRRIPFTDLLSCWRILKRACAISCLQMGGMALTALLLLFLPTDSGTWRGGVQVQIVWYVPPATCPKKVGAATPNSIQRLHPVAPVLLATTASKTRRPAARNMWRAPLVLRAWNPERH